jgi:hypothetical protein
VGEIPCELGAKVDQHRAGTREGFFLVRTKAHAVRMHPVESRTGAIRLEDPKCGAMWLQLGNKSMLMSQKLGQRLADECMTRPSTRWPKRLKPARSPAPQETLRAATDAPATNAHQIDAPPAPNAPD